MKIARRSGERPHSAWHFKGTKGAVLKLCDEIASFMKADEPKMGPVPVLLPGCVLAVALHKVFDSCQGHTCGKSMIMVKYISFMLFSFDCAFVPYSRRGCAK